MKCTHVHLSMSISVMVFLLAFFSTLALVVVYFVFRTMELVCFVYSLFISACNFLIWPQIVLVCSVLQLFTSIVIHLVPYFVVKFKKKSCIFIFLIFSFYGYIYVYMHTTS